MEKPLLNDEDILKKLDEGFESLDTRRREGLEDAQVQNRIDIAAAEQEQRRLTVKYGPDHPRVLSLGARLSQARALGGGIAEEIDRTSVKPPPFDASSWRVHGRVFDKENRPQEGLTVFFASKEGVWIRELGYACTDAKGYYALDASGELAARNRDLPLYLSVSGADKQLLCRQTEALTAAAGQIDYRDIHIGSKLCQQPPGSGEPDVPPVSKDPWTVEGKVTDRSGQQPLAKWTVQLRDKEEKFTQLLGKTATNSKGEFQLVYKPAEVPDLFTATPELTLQVLDPSGAVKYTSGNRKLKPDAGKAEKFEIKIA